MRPRFLFIAVTAFFVVALSFAVGVDRCRSQDNGPSIPPPPVPQQADDAQASGGAEALTTGPVHEAFASPVDLNPKAGPVLTKRPPDPISEIPPAQKPDGDNVVWIPGYWAWDDDRENYLWVSGVYRAAPPYQTWVPGYWEEVNGGFQWTAGFWAKAAQENVDYLPAPPPESLENGPNGPAPSENQFWVPGNWVYQNVNVAQPYAWRPGYWAACQPDWIFVPPHYVWTPGGYVYVDGYWDYTLGRRGCLFAPLYFNQPVYLQAGYAYTPSVLINVGVFSDCLFVRPAFCHYYFGDYFGPRYVGLGFRPWCSPGISVSFGFDPLFTYYRWNNSRRNPNWLTSTRQHYELLNTNANLRPARTFAAQQQLVRAGGGKPGSNVMLATTLKQAATDPGQSNLKFHTVSQSDRMAMAAKGKELQQVSTQRMDLENKNFQLDKGKTANDKNGTGTGFGNAGSKFGDSGPKLGDDTDTGKGQSQLGKLKLPTAAASNLKTAAGTTGNSGSQGNVSGSQGGIGGGQGNPFSGGNRGRISGTQGDASSNNNNNNSGDPGTKSRIDRSMLTPGGGGNPGGGNSGTGSGAGSGAGAGLGNASGLGSGAAGGQGSGRSQPRILNSNPGNGGNGIGGNPSGASGFQGPTGNPGNASGGAAGRGSGGGGQQQKDKDDPKKKSSDISPPRTNMVLTPPSTGPFDTQGVLKADRQARTGMTKSGVDEINRQFKSAQKFDLGLNDNDDDTNGPSTNRRSSTSPGNTSQGIAGQNGPSSPTQQFGRTAATPGTPGRPGYPNPNGMANNSLPTSGNGVPNPGNLSAFNPQAQISISPYTANYDYQSLMQRGQALSPGTTASPGSAVANLDNGTRPKDPVVPYGARTGQSRSASGIPSGPSGPSFGPTGPVGLAGPSAPSLNGGGQALSGISGPMLSGMYGPHTSGMTAQMSSGASAPMTSGISAPMASGVSAHMASGMTAPMTSGMSGLSNPTSPRGSGSYISSGSYFPGSAGSLTGGQPQPDGAARSYNPSSTGNAPGTYIPH